MPKALKVEIALLTINVFVTTFFAAAGWTGAATISGYLGTSLILAGTMFYIVFFDSKKRWPSKSAFDRYASVITFDSSKETPQ